TQMFDRMLRCCDELGKTLQPRLVLDCALIDVATIEPLVPLGDLIDRLGELEGRIARGGGPRPAPPSGGGGGRPAARPAAPPSSAGQARSSKGASAAPVEAAPAPSERASARSVPTAVPQSAPATQSAPVSMQPSGPVPKAEKIADGSGPTDGAPAKIPLPTSPQEALSAWARVIDHLEQQRKISLRGYYEFARVLRWTADELDLGFAPDDESRWAGESAAEQVNINELRTVLAELGHKVKVTVRMLDHAESKGTSARSLVESTREKSSAERSKREQEAREHPITKHVLQAFGASIKEIKTDV
ncbi:MAG TPA: hypothetical protein VFS15_26305, partial [Kofleriaceae bacterium]|nr:hypothetical protein [Kofleriaceae bacterium]